MRGGKYSRFFHFLQVLLLAILLQKTLLNFCFPYTLCLVAGFCQRHYDTFDAGWRDLSNMKNAFLFLVCCAVSVAAASIAGKAIEVFSSPPALRIALGRPCERRWTFSTRKWVFCLLYAEDLVATLFVLYGASLPYYARSGAVSAAVSRKTRDCLLCCYCDNVSAFC